MGLSIANYSTLFEEFIPSMERMIPREFIIDMFASDGYTKHLVVSNGVPGKTIDYRTGAIN